MRHPSEIPLEYRVSETPPVYNMNFINNVSEGGLSFQSSNYIEPEKWLHIFIPIDKQYFEADAQVRWCKPCTQEKITKAMILVSVFAMTNKPFQRAWLNKSVTLSAIKTTYWKKKEDY